MGRKKMKDQELKEKIEKPSSFTLKITNLRKTAYPGPLERTDYYGLRPGQFLRRSTAIYEIISIQRETFTDKQYDYWNSAVNRYGRISDQNFKNLIEEYKKKGNFGVCSLKIKTVIRGPKAVAKGKVMTILELDQAPFVSYRASFQPVELEETVQRYEYSIAKETLKLNKVRSKVNNLEDCRNAITQLLYGKSRLMVEEREEDGEISTELITELMK